MDVSWTASCRETAQTESDFSYTTQLLWASAKQITVTVSKHGEGSVLCEFTVHHQTPKHFLAAICF